MSSPYPRVWMRLSKTGVRMHRLVAQTALGRTLEPGEIVHHRNGDKLDNRPDNLEVLPSQRHHMVLEHLQRKQARGIEPLFEPEIILRLID